MVILKFVDVFVAFLDIFDCMNVHCVIPPSENGATVVLSRPVSPIAQAFYNFSQTKALA